MRRKLNEDKARTKKFNKIDIGGILAVIGLTRSLGESIILPNGYIEEFEINSSERLNQIFAALADPTRRAILARLTAGETTVMDLARPFKMTQPAVSKHLRVLEKAGLITQGRDAQHRPRKAHFRTLAAICDWIEPYRPYIYNEMNFKLRDL